VTAGCRVARVTRARSWPARTGELGRSTAAPGFTSTQATRLAGALAQTDPVAPSAAVVGLSKRPTSNGHAPATIAPARPALEEPLGGRHSAPAV